MFDNKIIENQEVLDKVNFRLRFNAISSIFIGIFYIICFITGFIDEIYYASNNLNTIRENWELTCSVVEIVLSLVLLICFFVHFKHALELKDKIRYNRKIGVFANAKTCFMASVFVVCGTSVYFLIILIELFSAKTILFNSYVIIIPFFILFISCFILKFSSEIKKIMGIITGKTPN